MKKVVKIRLEYIEDPREHIILVGGISSDGVLASKEMYGYVVDNDTQEGITHYPIVVQVDDDAGSEIECAFEWGWNDKTETYLRFLKRPVSVGQQITREETVDNETNEFLYTVVSVEDYL